MKKETAWVLCASGILLLAVFGWIIFSFLSHPTAQDHDRFTALIRDVEKHYELRFMVEDGSRPAIYGTGLAYSDHIDIHGEYTDREVAEIVSVISDAQARRADKKPIEVRFFAKVNGRGDPYKEVTVRR